MTIKEVAQILRAADVFASTDATRLYLAHVRVTGRRIEATDGHRLVRIDLSEGTGLADGLYDGAAAARRLLAGDTPAPAAPDEGVWPDFDAVIPREATREPCATVALDPALLGEIATAIARIVGKKKPIQIDLYGALDPVRFTARHDGITVLALLMPMRA